MQCGLAAVPPAAGLERAAHWAPLKELTNRVGRRRLNRQEILPVQPEFGARRRNLHRLNVGKDVALRRERDIAQLSVCSRAPCVDDRVDEVEPRCRNGTHLLIVSDHCTRNGFHPGSREVNRFLRSVGDIRRVA